MYASKNTKNKNTLLFNNADMKPIMSVICDKALYWRYAKF